MGFLLFLFPRINSPRINALKILFFFFSLLDASATHFKHDQDVPEEAIVAQTNNEVLTSAFEVLSSDHSYMRSHLINSTY